MRNWTNDRVFRTLMKNTGALGSAKILGAIIGLGSLTCASRTLAAAEFGTLMLIHTYALSAGALTKFQSWQMILKFGARPYEKGNTAVVKNVIRFAVGLDITSGVLGALLGICVILLFHNYFGIEDQYRNSALFYCTLIPTMSAATPVGILRLFDRFDLISQQQTVTPILRGCGALAACWSGSGLTGFLITWYVADIVGDIILWQLAIRELVKKNLLDALKPSLRTAPQNIPGSWRFVWLTNLNTTLDACWSPIGNLIVGGTLGASDGGRYKIATTVLDAAVKPARFLEKGFYPEIMRLDPRTRHPWQLAVKVGFLSACIGALITLTVWIGGHPLISLFGSRYSESSMVMMIMAPALIFSMGGFPLESLLYMAGRAHSILIAQVASAVLYIGSLFFLSGDYGLQGAAWAYVVGIIALQLFSGVFAFSAYLKR